MTGRPAEVPAEGWAEMGIDLTVGEPVDAEKVDVSEAQFALGESLADKRENVRGKLAQGLTLLLAVVVLGAGAVLVAAPDRLEVMSEFLKIVFTPLVGLVGSAIGFYFGSRADESERSGVATRKRGR